jgi:hypothetical protein
MSSSKKSGGRGMKLRITMLAAAAVLGTVSVLSATQPTLPADLDVDGRPAEIRDAVASFWGVPIGVGSGLFGAMFLLGALKPAKSKKKS